MKTPARAKRSAVGKVTLNDVAERVGVSAITISRALRTPEKVSEVLRQRIDEAVQELGYRPNYAARALASARSHTVVVLVPSLSNEVFVDTLSGIYETLHPRGYQVLIGNSRYSKEEEERLLSAYLTHNPDGILVTGFEHTAEVERLLANAGCPVVYMMEMDEQGQRPCVGFSQYECGLAMTNYLLQRGYQRIGFMAVQGDSRVLKRWQGYQDSLKQAERYDPRREHYVPDSSSVGLGAELLAQMLEQAPDLDAVFCCNDDLAQGALFYCQRHGIRVPEQLAIVGFNDLAASAWTVPSLTSIATPRYAIGKRAAELFLQLAEGQTPEQTAFDLGFELVARESA
ncbi:transcriptional regulator [Pokkaliibacter plantistimulans]|uniref:Transcriptional regulator n=1 Tax=Proteobacteria bacterium 228 TaxID=2083153 RepID=A0A2S5KI57_9PROT|nr:LacI family DNA-binding transcriptional regulator [Pokkaliibacter plantistimulans]PPC74325.1 transcriptional regulator [Pokkaliibacter plantistimulans]